MFQGIGPWEILLIFLALLLMFGAKRIPEIARGLGKGVTEFKNALQDVKSGIEATPEDSPESPPPGQTASSSTPSNSASNVETTENRKG